MNAERLLQLYDRVSEAPDAIPRLRRFISDLAVRGKLVEQAADDTHPSKILKDIRAKKAALIKSGEIRNPRPPPAAESARELFALPEPWIWARLDELSPRGLSDGDWIETKDQSLDGGVRLIQLADVGVGQFLDKSSRFITLETEKRLNCTRLLEGDVLIARLPNPIGRACVFPDIGQPAITAVDVAILRVGEGLSPSFLVYAINAPPTFAQVEAYGKGSTRFRVSTGHLKTVRIPLPPLAEQHRIVAKVDELMALCDCLEAGRKKREATRDRLTTASLSRLTAPDVDEKQFKGHADFAIKVLPELTTRPDQIKALRQTILDLAVRGKLVEQEPNDEPASESLARLLDQKRAAHLEEGLRQRPPVAKPTRLDFTFEFPVSWDLTCFDDVFVVVSGITKGQRVNPQDAVEVPYLRVANVQRGYLDLAIVKSISVKEIDVQRYQLRNGDILMTEGGDWDKLGRAAIWQEEISHCIHQNHVFRLRPPSTDILPEWVVAYANSPSGRSFFEGASKQTTNLASINMTQLRGCPLPLPPLAEQYRIVTKVNQLMMFCEQIEKARTTESNRQIQLLEALLLETMQPMVQRAAS